MCVILIKKNEEMTNQRGESPPTPEPPNSLPAIEMWQKLLFYKKALFNEVKNQDCSLTDLSEKKPGAFSLETIASN